MNIFLKLKFFLINLLAGKSTILINVEIDNENGVILDKSNSFINNVKVSNFKNNAITIK